MLEGMVSDRGIRGHSGRRHIASRKGSRQIMPATRPTLNQELDGPWEKDESKCFPTQE